MITTCSEIVADNITAMVSNNATVHALRSLATVNVGFLGLLLVNAKDNSCTVPDDQRCMNAYVLALMLFVYSEFWFLLETDIDDDVENDEVTGWNSSDEENEESRCNE
ncbi:hypothetical protein FQA39_LY13251 [Lamprigera yunnana]|nr:hypothetical protein FQA39_LY13251 [Lamprigera yunnana]